MRDIKLVASTDAERLKNQERKPEQAPRPEKSLGIVRREKIWRGRRNFGGHPFAQVPREYYEELRETVRVGLQEQRARERAERAEAARKIREDRDKKRQQEREAAKAKKKNNTPLAGNARGPVNVTPHGLLAGTVRLFAGGAGHKSLRMRYFLLSSAASSV